jgi:uncharacterized protein (TIGR02099 family)
LSVRSFLSSGIARTTLVWTGRILLIIYFIAGALFLAGRHLLVPEVAAQRTAVEQRLAEAIGLPVKIAALSADWPGLHPHLTIEGLEIHDREGRPALAFDRVEAEIGWSSLLHFELRLHRLEIASPALDIRRDLHGVIHVAGLAVRGEGDSGFADWLLEQSRIIVREARVTWHDDLRGATPLELQHVNFDLRNFARFHSFGLTASPSGGTAQRVDLRGNLVGKSLSDLPGWRGEFYVDLVQADLSAWQPWLDLPLEWSRGLGSVRLWLGFAGLRAERLTADLRLDDVALRLRPDLPVLTLAHLEGRLSGQRAGSAYAGNLRRLSLETDDGRILPPTDARFRLDLAGPRAGGEFSVDQLDIDVLSSLASHLPLPAQAHERLRTFAPQGRLGELDLAWEGPAEAPTAWRAKSGFSRLALKAHKELPGFAGISGTLDGDQRAGKVRIDSRDVRIMLPAVFPEPELALARLEAEVGWRKREGEIEFQLARAEFHNADARGDAVGSYRHTGRGPGEIDLTARLTQAAGNAVWRYMPLVVNKDTRDWLRAGIVGGRSENATLRLKGPLDKFPFRDGKGGIFQVKGRILGATLDFATGWPRMTGIDGELLFEGVRMAIRGQRAEMMGVALSNVLAEIPDLEAPEELLIVTGKARGETQRFLDFIEASPVGERIDHFTQPMAAAGRGELDLRLDMPLRRIDTTRVRGSYKFADNELKVLPELPPFSGLQGEFGFTESRLQAKNLRARLLGMPVAADVGSAAGGVVRVEGRGTLQAQSLRRELGPEYQPLLGHLSGESAWRANVTIRKPVAEVSIESALDGVSSSLPEPFNKSARTPLPFKVIGRIETQRDEWNASLGNVATLRLLRDGTDWRGRVALGAAARGPLAALPERGIALAIDQPALDADAWRALLPAAGSGIAQAGPALSVVEVRSDMLHLVHRNFHEVRFKAATEASRWRLGIESREARGQLTWDGAGAGKLAGRMALLAWPGAQEAPAAGEAESDATRELPAVDLVIDDMRLRDMALGEVRVNGESRGGAWQAKVEAKNEAAQLSGTGRWRPSATAPESALSFRLKVDDAEKLLARLGMTEALRRGSGTLEGDLSWAGAPFSLDLPSLSGNLKADIAKGQFKKLEPGVGRLLGVLSLQSLPRRITLDFRDVFSEGFAFDTIAGTARVERGILRTDDLAIRGPAAKVQLSGRANLVTETQDLKVRVQPAVGESVAVGAMIVNPVAGAVAWAAQKLLDDPLDQAFAYEYAVTGGWTDPKVEKLARKPPEKQDTKGPPQ